MSASLKFGFLSTVLAFCLYTAGLKNLDNGKASILASVEPVAATLIGVILYKETLSAGEIFGILIWNLDVKRNSYFIIGMPFATRR
ncbi:DMT family transporter [Coprococcus comes]|uniref:DMT family transporter n=2 Tax=Coprococcus comes TaxID=410072 RepID=UPI00319DE408